ncbi:ATP-binding cassette domain-containing protein [Verminephrobacter aporrectodeae subsp. tuberculatae]|uniref:ATP-binding cassette domain-containing protein n=1 Tax=Verminephrobacter aporrectodeae TaxID=1110389 RepID=UPI002244BEE1|nr:ATP-binding cassette domain-containing protein [Verminephrobacter aporrectodeae]MCW8208170.1 ATP-binding cassette domain-containing protein [Verminephrobacter aporrectodeae subsp. tuberculatae]
MADATGTRTPSALRTMRRELSLFAIVVLVLAGFGASTPRYLSAENLLNIGQQTAVIATVAYAMTAVIICRGVDISVGGTLAASSVLAALAMQSGGLPGGLGVLLVIAVGAAFGLLNGALASYAGISPLVATLAVCALARGMALSLSGARSVPVDSGLYLWFGSGSLFDVPVSFLIAVLLAGLWFLLLQRTVFGRWVYATGGNEDAARASLIPVRAVCLMTYVLAGASAGVGALLTTGRVGSAQPLSGAGLEFAAITAAVIGGTRLSGGHGSIVATALGALLLGAVNTGLSFLQVSQQVNYFVTGGFVIAAVVLGQRGSLPQFAPGSALRRRRSAPVAAAAQRAGTVDAVDAMAQPHTLELRAIGKRFGNVQALADVSLRLRSAEVLALVGENGAGKSTLVKLLAGIHTPQQGEILLDGRVLALASTQDSRAAGIAVIHQHFSLIPDLTVAENLALARGHLPKRFGCWLDRAAMRRSARQVLDALQLPVDPDAIVARLTIGQCQMVEIAKATLAEAWLIAMDEPTSALTNHERDLLYRLVGQLQQRGCCVLYISHKMQEIYRLAQRAVVLRDGRVVAEADLARTDAAALIRMMVGRDIREVFPFRPARARDLLLDVRQLSDRRLLQGIDLQVRSGELVALTGLMGSGRTELLRCIAGFAPFIQGRVAIGGAALRVGSAVHAARLGVAYVPEDRHREGFVGSMSLRDNLGLRWISAHNRAGFVAADGLRRLAAQLIARLGVRPPDAENLVQQLSGGNQQKIVLGKWLATEPRVLLLDEPTNGVDVGAKFEIHKLIADLKGQGVAILMVSSELPEVLGVADRIVVLSGGRVAGELARGATEEQVTGLAFKYA